MGAWFTALLPCVTVPSSGTWAPGAMRTVAPSGTWATGRRCVVPSAWTTSAVGGASCSRPRMAWRARSMAPSSMRSAATYRAMTMAASGHWPMRKAPVTATAMSAWMPRRSRARSFRPLLYTPRPASATAATASTMPAVSCCSQCAPSAPAARARAAAMRGQPGSAPWSCPSPACALPWPQAQLLQPAGASRDGRAATPGPGEWAWGWDVWL